MIHKVKIEDVPALEALCILDFPILHECMPAFWQDARMFHSNLSTSTFNISFTVRNFKILVVTYQACQHFAVPDRWVGKDGTVSCDEG